MDNFDIFDRVVLIKDYPDGNDALVTGCTGTVVGIEEGNYYKNQTVNVQWDEYIYGHSCSGLCADGHGWNVEVSYIEIIPECVTDPDDNDLDDYFDSLMHQVK